MYILIRIGTNNSRSCEFVSKNKNKLEKHIKELGFYWSKKVGRYVDDKTTGISGGSGTDYIINEIEEFSNLL